VAAMISVVVCTHNRAESLRRTLRCLCALEPAGSFEVVVVDNRSTDHTRHVVQSFAGREPEVRYVHEPRLGVANARNRGIQEARGEILAFMDDDQTVPDDWLEAIEKAFRDPTTDLIFTRLYPVDASGERVTDRKLDFPERDYGPEPLLVEKGKCKGYFFGTGYSAFRISALREMGPFRTDLGRKGNREFMGEDTEMYHRFLSGGRTIRYWPDAIVYHHIPAGRATWRYALRKAFDRGVSWAPLEPVPPIRRIFGVPLFSVRECFGDVVILAKTLAADRARASRAMLKLVRRVGSVYGYFDEWRKRRAARG